MAKQDKVSENEKILENEKKIMNEFSTEYRLDWFNGKKWLEWNTYSDYKNATIGQDLIMNECEFVKATRLISLTCLRVDCRGNFKY